jgi:tetratricopeptide (TPR) repeat protein
MGNTDKAIDTVKLGIDARADIPQFYALKASLLDDQGRYKEAVGLLKGAVERFSKNEQLHFFLGSMYDKSGDFENTIATMKRVLAINEYHVQALNYLAYTYAEKGVNLEEAEELAQKAVRLAPDDGYIMDTMGWVLYKQGRISEALKFLEAAHKLNSTESIIAEHLGDAYFRFQLPTKAKLMYQKAIKVEKNASKIQRLRVKITSIDQSQKVSPLRLPAAVD